MVHRQVNRPEDLMTIAMHGSQKTKIHNISLCGNSRADGVGSTGSRAPISLFRSLHLECRKWGGRIILRGGKRQAYLLMPIMIDPTSSLARTGFFGATHFSMQVKLKRWVEERSII
jgi:hypothetical protein